MAEMWQPKPLHRHRHLILLLLATVLACTVAGEDGGDGGKPLVTAITKDASTLLYSAPVIKTGSPLVLDLSGPMIWSTCPDDASSPHDTIDCNSAACMRAHRYHPPGCPHTGYGQPDTPRNPYRCKCTAHPHNPVGSSNSGHGGSTPSSGQDLTRVALSANATDGNNPLNTVTFTAVASCAPESMLENLPEGALGVAGLGRSDLSLPAQVARSQSVRNKFALCLPSGNSGNGVAVFGGGPLFLLPPGRPDIAANLAGETPLVKYKECPGYYVTATGGIAVNQAALAPLDNGDGCGPLVVGFSTTLPYTELRSDLYRAFIKAFDAATPADIPRLPASGTPKFELCYDSTKLGSTRLGYAVPQVDVMLDGGKNWTVFGGNSMAQVNNHTACLAFVEMGEGKARYGGGGGGEAAPAVVIGGFQMENNLVVFDEEKMVLGFSGLLWGRQTTCSNFNFTMAAV